MTTPPDACDISGLIDWPDELGYTRITAHLFQAFADGCDEDEQPDMKAATGTLTLTYNTGAFKYTPSDSSQPTRMIGGRTIACTVLPDGTITNSGSGQTSDGSVIIMATDSEQLEPREATVTANFSLSQGPAIQPVTFVPRADTTVNLADLPDMAKSPGVIVRPIVTEDTAVRAEAAALRAEQAAAGVADISEQVEQVQAYTTRAETAASNAETAATSAEAASAEAATVTTDAAYIRDVIAQHGTLKGDPGPAPVVEWQGDRLSVNGELGPSLTGAPGQDGGPVPVGGTAGQVVTRTGDGGVAWTDAALYKSTRLTLHDDGKYSVKLRRVGDLVICSISVNQNREALSPISIPFGYQRADPVDLQRLLYRGGVAQNNGFGGVRFNGQTIIYNGALDVINVAHVEVWDTDDPHPII